MKYALWFIFLAAFLLGAISAARVEFPPSPANEKRSGKPIHNPAWEWFFLSFFLGTGSVVLMRKNQSMKQVEENEPSLDDEVSSTSAEYYLQKIMNHFKDLSIDDLSAKSVEPIQKVCLKMAYHRHNYQQIYGIHEFSQFFEPFSHGERYLNRTWSALVDGNQLEARRAYEISMAYFNEAFEIVHRPGTEELA